MYLACLRRPGRVRAARLQLFHLADQVLGDFDPRGFLGVDDLTDHELSGHVQQHAGVILCQTQLFRQKVEHLPRSLDGRLVQRVAVRDGDPLAVVFDHGEGQSCLRDNVDGERRPAFDLQSAVADLAVGHDRVEVSGRKKGAGHEDRQIQRSAFFDAVAVHVAAVIHGGHGGDRFACRSHTDDADHGTDGHLNAFVIDHAVLHAQPVDDRFFEDTCQRAARRTDVQDADRAEFDLVDVDLQHVARHGSVDIDRTGCRIADAAVHVRKRIAFGQQATVIAVERLETYGLAGCDVRCGRVGSAERAVCVLPGYFYHESCLL